MTLSYKLSVPVYQSNTIKSDSVAIIRDTDIVDTHASMYNVQAFLKSGVAQKQASLKVLKSGGGGARA